MVEVENLNLFSRRQLLDSLKLLDSGSPSAQRLRQILAGPPENEFTENSRDDIFNILLDLDTIEEISINVEHYASGLAEDYVVTIEEEDTNETDEARFYYWQELSEKWNYLELMLAMG